MVKLLKPIVYVFPHHVAVPSVTAQEYILLQIVAKMNTYD